MDGHLIAASFCFSANHSLQHTVPHFLLSPSVVDARLFSFVETLSVLSALILFSPAWGVGSGKEGGGRKDGREKVWLPIFSLGNQSYSPVPIARAGVLHDRGELTPVQTASFVCHRE